MPVVRGPSPLHLLAPAPPPASAT
ncbi:putative basic proline-rich protein-like [Iris pallida]|uniref:Basic proline-rich protein-like n=1 Tax=Iris pallida TaxID=29817 RepID=A0AAX6HU08_IRIPA|nr:putative basic proline-rich protein-like [Iris pallida]KAJ6844067.1 putative basic proline-rich protein-like [Iris pallida]